MAKFKGNCIGKQKNFLFSSGSFLLCFQSTDLSLEELIAKRFFLKTHTVWENVLQWECRQENIRALFMPLRYSEAISLFNIRPQEQVMTLKSQTAGRDSMNVLSHPELLINEWFRYFRNKIWCFKLLFWGKWFLIETKFQYYHIWMISWFFLSMYLWLCPFFPCTQINWQSRIVSFRISFCAGFLGLHDGGGVYVCICDSFHPTCVWKRAGARAFSFPHFAKLSWCRQKADGFDVVIALN